jgi:hypothetical protein
MKDVLLNHGAQRTAGGSKLISTGQTGKSRALGSFD